MGAKKNELVLQEEILVTTEGTDLTATESTDESGTVKIKYQGNNLSFTIGSNHFQKGTVALLDTEMAALALKNPGFERV